MYNLNKMKFFKMIIVEQINLKKIKMKIKNNKFKLIQNMIKVISSIILKLIQFFNYLIYLIKNK